MHPFQLKFSRFLFNLTIAKLIWHYLIVFFQALSIFVFKGTVMTGIIFIFFACLLWAADTLIRYPLLFGGSSAQQIVLFEHLILVTVLIGLFVLQRRKLTFFNRSTIVPFIIIGIFQAATSIQEMTLSFIPKLGVMVLALIAFGSWQIAVMVDFFQRIFERIPTLFM